MSELSGTTAERDDAVRVTFEIEVYNPTDRREEKVLEIAVPPTAAVDRFGMWVRGRYMEGEIAPRARARRVFEEYAYGRGVDPALLTWVRADLCRARVFPIFPRSSTKLLLSYVVPRPPGRRLVLPKPLDEGELTTAFVRPSQMHFRRLRPDEHGAPRVRAYSPKKGEPGYFAADLPVPRETSGATAADVVLVLRDTSYSMKDSGVPPDALPTVVVHSTPPRYQIDFDVGPRQPRRTWPFRQEADAPRDCEGGTDIGRAFEAAASFLKGRQFGMAHVILVSDGEDTCGEPDPDRWVRPLDRFGPGKVTVSCRGAAPRLAAALGRYHASGRGYTNARIKPIGGASALGNSFQAVVPPNGIIRVYGRYEQPEVRLSISYQTSGGVAHTKQYVLGPSHDAGNTHLPRLWARARMDDLELAASLAQDRAEREKRGNEARQLALDYQVLSPRASFLVLESERDFRESGVERKERAEGWAEADTGAMRTAPAERSAWTPPSNVIALSVDTEDPHVLRLDRVYREVLGSYEPRPEDEGALPGLGRGGVGDTKEMASGRTWYPLSPTQVEGLSVEPWESYQVGYGQQRFRSPPCGWVFRPARGEREPSDAEAIRLWAGSFAPLVFGPADDDSNRWVVAREGRTAVLARLNGNGGTLARFRITETGIETELPCLDLIYANDPRNAGQLDRLLDRFPFPTLFPLPYLARHYDVDVRREGGRAVVRLVRTNRVMEFELIESTGLPARVLRLARIPGWCYELECEVEGDQLVMRDPEIPMVTRFFCRRAPDGAPPSTLGRGAMRIGFLEAHRTWDRVLAGEAEALVQSALAEDDGLSRLDYLDRAAELLPDNPTIAALRADTLAALGRTREVRSEAGRLRAMLGDLPKFRADNFRLFLAGVEARLGADKIGPYVHLAEEVGRETPLGRAALAAAERIRLFLAGHDRARGERSFWPGTTDPKDALRRRFSYNSSEARQLREIIKGQDAEALAKFLTERPAALATWLVRDRIDGATGVVTHKRSWPEEKVLRFLDMMAADPEARRRVSAWLCVKEEFVRQWYEKQLEEYPDWKELRLVRVGRNVGGEYARLTRLRNLAEPPHSLGERIRARAALLSAYSWTLADVPGCFEETVALLNGVGSPLERWRLLAQLQGPAASQFDPRLPSDSLEKQGRILRAFLEVPEAELLHHFGTTGGYWKLRGWSEIAARYLIALARAGRIDEARREYDSFFASSPEPSLEAYVRSGCRDATLDYRNVLERAEEHAAGRKTAAQIARALSLEGGKPGPPVLSSITGRGIGRDVTRECIRRFPEAPYALAWGVFETPRDEEAAREARDAVLALRKRLGMKHLFGRALLALCFRNGLLGEAAEEAAGLEAAAPAEVRAGLLRAAAVSLTGDGERARPAFRAILDRLGPGGRSHGTVVAALKATHRYQWAFELRQEAIEAYKKLRGAGKLPGKQSVAYEWSWLDWSDPDLLDNAVVEKGTAVTVPRSGDFRDRLESSSALGRWGDYARVVGEHLGDARDDEERFGWLKVLLQRTSYRDLPQAIRAWVEGVIASGKPIPPDIAHRIGLRHRIMSVNGYLKRAERWWKKGHHNAARRYAMYASGLAVRHRSADEAVRVFRASVDSFGKTPWAAAYGLWRFPGPPEEIAGLLDEAVSDVAKRALGGENVNDATLEMAAGWSQKRAELGARIDKLVLAARGKTAPETVLRIMQKTGWGGLSEDELWRTVADRPEMITLARCGRPYLDYLRRKKRWDEALSFAEVLERHGARYQGGATLVVDLLAEAGRREEAVSRARRRRLYDFLIGKGEEELGAAAAREVMERESCDPESYAFLKAAVRLFAVESWHGRPERAARVLLKCIPRLRKHTDPSNAFSRVAEFSDYAFHPRSREGPPRRVAWKDPKEGGVAALAVASALLAADPEPRGWETTSLAGMCCLRAAAFGENRETRAKGFTLLLECFERFHAGGWVRAARDLAGCFGWFQKADPLDPLPEHILASIAAAEACGGFSPRTGLPFEPNYDGWGKLPRARRLELLRRASRLLELYPASGPMRRDDLSALERYEYPAHLAEDDPDFVPTPRQWLMREMRRHRHLLVPME